MKLEKAQEKFEIASSTLAINPSLDSAYLVYSSLLGHRQAIKDIYNGSGIPMEEELRFLRNVTMGRWLMRELKNQCAHVNHFNDLIGQMKDYFSDRVY